MTFHYPNGKSFDKANTHAPTDKPTDSTIFGKRGMSLEEEINLSNQYYRIHDIAIIHKKPTPIQIVKVDYPARSQAVIKEAYFRQPSTTDYNGVYQGYYLDFEAKETKNKTSFPFRNFHTHQIEHMRQCLKQQGICFVIMKFVTLEQIYLLSASHLITAWDNQDGGGRKSLPLSYVKEVGFPIKYGLNPLIPYLTAVDCLLHNVTKGENNGQ